MILEKHHYVPCLRWKLGEYQALFFLKDTTKERITPLIEVSEIGWDFEKKENAKNIDDHLKPFAQRVKIKWQKRWCFIDLKLIESDERLNDGTHPVEYIFSKLRIEECRGIPVTCLERDKYYQQAIRLVSSKDKYGVCLRLQLEQLAKPSIKDNIDALLSSIKAKPKKVDLVLDLGSPNFVPIEGFVKMVELLIKKLPYRKKWRNFILIGTSFPESMAEVKKGSEIVTRYEWLLYKKLLKNTEKTGARLPIFGDYAISHPKVLQLDMRILKPSATIRYTVDDAWNIIKGMNVRDYGLKQYRKLSKRITSSPLFIGAKFSDGDQYIADCASGGKTGNLPMWRRVGTNHHLEKVAYDLANLFA